MLINKFFKSAISKIINIKLNVYKFIKSSLISQIINKFYNFIKHIRLYFTSTKLINLVLTIILVWVTKNQFDLNESIKRSDESIRAGHKYKIAQQTREFTLEYINYCIEFIIRESNVILIIDPEFSTNDTIKDYICFQPYDESLEIQTFIGLPITYDLMGDKMLNYFKTKPFLDINVYGILDEDEVKQFLALQSSIRICTEQISYLIKRIRGSYVATIQLYLKNENRDKIPKNHQFDPKSHIHKNWLNEARNKIKAVKMNTNKFLSLFSSTGVDTLNFILQVESSVPFSKCDNFCNEPSTRSNSTIRLDSTYYEFNYFNYFICNYDTFELLQNNNGITTWFNRIN